MTRIQEFDGLRAFAVLIVIADHYAPVRNFAYGAPARLGGLGVDVFFVLSGYLITTILLGLRTADRPYQTFYARRFLRILPPYFLLLVLVYGIATLLREPIVGSTFLGQVLFLRSFKGTGAVLERLWSVLSGVTPIPGVLHKVVSGPSLRDYPWLPMTGSLGPTWSLSVEEWFYLLWAPVVLIFRRRTILIIAASVGVMGFCLRWLAAGRTDFLSSVDILVTGAALALWIEHRTVVSASFRRRCDYAIGISATGSFVLLVVLSLMHRDVISRTLIEVFVFGGLAWIIHNAGRSHPICTALRFKPFVYIGTISYMVYLIHLPIYFVVRSALNGVTPGLSEGGRAWAVFLCSVSATIAFSALSWKYYEQPILRFKDHLTEEVTLAKRPCMSSTTATPPTFKEA
jgi:peptidoglycan/LPS O-acetylase OafA/YrhL